MLCHLLVEIVLCASCTWKCVKQRAQDQALGNCYLAPGSGKAIREEKAIEEELKEQPHGILEMKVRQYLEQSMVMLLTGKQKQKTDPWVWQHDK